MKQCFMAACVAALATSAAANDPRKLGVQNVGGSGSTEVVAQIWVDNWFELHVNGQAIAQDSVAYKTERSFNAEQITFKADLPMTVAIELRDYMENATGLEYIGSRKQQMGDGGAIMQFLSGGKVIGVSSSGWKCHVAQQAPMNASCEKARNPQEGVGDCAANDDVPSGDWTSASFNDGSWPPAVEHSASAVGPKDGYSEINWSSAAKIIWSDDLERDNIVLCRATIG